MPSVTARAAAATARTNKGVIAVAIVGLMLIGVVFITLAISGAGRHSYTTTHYTTATTVLATGAAAKTVTVSAPSSSAAAAQGWLIAIGGAVGGLAGVVGAGFAGAQWWSTRRRRVSAARAGP